MSGMADLDRTALVVVDVQEGFDDPFWGAGNNPACEGNIATLVQAWRAAGRPVVFVRHDDVDSTESPLHPASPGNRLKPLLGDAPDLLVSKRVHSSFHGSPDLAAWLRERDLDAIAVCGITTNHCCETTARVGNNLGFEVLFVLDATRTFELTGPDGTAMSADELARATATNLHEEFATVVSTADIAERAPAPG
jgi:nicotinamidase-related amidase